jgi:L-ascorbate metabolism protein UlaG (beta-lactamase superfamily)
MKITWLGHATVLIELDGVRLLTDPVLGRRVGALKRVAPPFAPEAVADVDAVLLSHLHADHADVASLKQVASPLAIAPRGAGGWLARRTGGEVREIAPGEEQRLGEVRIEATRATHDARRWPIGIRAEPVGYVVRGTRSAYFAGDTDLFGEMAELAGSIDVALLPVAGWGANLGPGHLDAARAAEAAVRIAPRVAIPIHWGTLAPRRPLRRHPEPSRPAREFGAILGRRAPGVEVRILAPGSATRVY